jgi:DNA-binding response OmpR family regulator
MRWSSKMPRKLRILIIDSDPDTVSATRAYLEKNGYEVITANNGVTGLRRAREDKPDLVILDIIMPVMSGIEICVRLRENPETARTPVLMFTPRANTDDLSKRELQRISQRVDDMWRGFEVGAMDYVPKPVTEEKMLRAVRAILWSRGARFRTTVTPHTQG